MSRKITDPKNVLVGLSAALLALPLAWAQSSGGSLPQLPATEQPVRSELLALVRQIQTQLGELVQNDPQNKNSAQIAALRSELELLVLQAEIEKLQRENMALEGQLQDSAASNGASGTSQAVTTQATTQPVARRIAELSQQQRNLNAQLSAMADQHAEMLVHSLTDPAAGVQTYTVRPGDSLSELAQTFYGNSARWPEILAANPEITNPDMLFVGTRLVIP